jgi:hypothetical protein
MGSLATAAVVGAFLGGLALDIGVNALQDWYQTLYADAFWSARVEDSPALRALRIEEAEIARILARSPYEGASAPTAP